jgi:hypothetical protein
VDNEYESLQKAATALELSGSETSPETTHPYDSRQGVHGQALLTCKLLISSFESRHYYLEKIAGLAFA